MKFIDNVKSRLAFNKKGNLELKTLLISLALISVLGIFAYANSLNNEFAVIDDYTSILENPDVSNISLQLKSRNLQRVLYALITSVFGMNPLPFRITSLVFHLLVASIFYLVIWSVSRNKWLSLASASLFVVHPVTTEAVSWISASTYLHVAFFTLCILLAYILYKHKEDNRYLYASLGLFTFYVIVYPTPWLIIVPLTILIVDQFILESKFNFSKIPLVLLFFIPIVLFYLPSAFESYQIRMSDRAPESQTKKLINQQKLSPVTESYAYTTYTMLKQYAFPTDLVVYHDGIEVRSLDLGPMYLVFFLFIIAIAYAYKKDRKIAGLLLLLPILILPSYSPIKITWYITERYLYLGTGVFSILLCLGIYKFVYLKNKILANLIVILLILISIFLTYDRNKDWKSPITLANATIESAPLSVRPYNDLGYYYMSKGDYRSAIDAYYDALEIDPLTGTAIHNLGYIFIQDGLPALKGNIREISLNQTLDDENEVIRSYLETARIFIDNGDNQKALYFVNNALNENPSSIDGLATASNIYAQLGDMDRALEIYTRITDIEGETPPLTYMLSFLYYTAGDYQSALEVLQGLQKTNPEYPQLKESIDNLERIIKEEYVTENL